MLIEIMLFPSGESLMRQGGALALCCVPTVVLGCDDDVLLSKGVEATFMKPPQPRDVQHELQGQQFEPLCLSDPLT